MQMGEWETPKPRDRRTRCPRPAMRFRMPGLALGAGLILLIAGCGRPHRANVELRRVNQQLESRIDELERLRAAERARVQALEKSVGTLPTLPQERLDAMFTVHNIRIGDLTGGTSLDVGRKGDEGIKVYLTPLDDADDPLKATGRITVEAFDLNADPPQRLGRWEFSPQAVKESWRGFGLIRAFVVICPWQVVPKNQEISLRIEFEDALTGRAYRASRDVTIDLPEPPAAPANNAGQ
jgi:hypothetical protein